MFLITLLLWIVLCNNVDLISVRLEQGMLRGEIRNRSTGNGQYYSFKGIPYAAPPIGDLRFKAPQPPLPWNGERNAIEHGPVCPQAEYSTGKYIPGNEDCLFLNVYTPKMTARTLLPVMFYIHGGAFVSGSGNDDQYGPDFLLDEEVVIVTINYRLGPLGFLCLDIEEVPGNAGLKDQVIALQWVKKNIHKFGGDSNEITIFGQSAGGSSVTLHALSQMSKNLFNRGIAMSGVCLNDNSLAFEPKRHSLLLAQKLGFYTRDPYRAFRFLQNVPVRAIVTAMPSLLANNQVRKYVLKSDIFAPVKEKNFGGQHFIIEDPFQMLQEGKTNGVDLIIGHTSNEGITRAVSQIDYILRTYPFFEELLVPTKFIGVIAPKKILELADMIHNHYFGRNQISEQNYKDFIKFYSYMVYVYDVHRFLEIYTKSTKGQNKVYYYQFSCFTERNTYGRTALKYGVRGAGHLDDLMYVFDGKQNNLTLNKRSLSYREIVQTCKLLTNFAKYGNPTPGRAHSTIWEEYNKNRRYLDIDYKLTLNPLNMTEINFWRRVFEAAGMPFS